MSKISIPNITSGYASTTALNNAFDSIETELNSKVLYRDNPDGEPNQMENNIDMNGFAIINASNVEINGLNLEGIVEDIQTASEIVSDSLDTVLNAADSASVSAAEAESSAAIVADWSFIGPWVTLTVYKKNNIVTQVGSSYICLVDHTAGTFSTDLTANKWKLLAEKGAAGAGTGDMLAANNLSDLANATTSRSNLGLGVLAVKGDGDKGDITVSSSGDIWTIDNSVVSTSKLQNNAVTVDKISTTLLNDFTTVTPAVGDLISLSDISNSNINSKATVENVVKAGLNSIGNPPVYGCRAWVSFNGVTTSEIYGSGNVSSITDNGVGKYLINFTTAMPDDNYVVIGTCNSTASTHGTTVNIGSTYTTTQVEIRLLDTALVDRTIVNVVIFR